MSHPFALRTGVTSRHHAAACSLALLVAAGCGNPAATAPVNTASTPAASSGTLGSLVSGFLTPSTITEVLAALKSANVLAALKKAWAAGNCKTEISALTSAGVTLATKSGIASLLGKGTADLSGVKTAFGDVAACLQKSAPDILAAFESALTASSSTSAGKALQPDLIEFTPEQLQALDTSLWPATSEEEPASAGGQAAAVAPEAGGGGPSPTQAVAPSPASEPAASDPASEGPSRSTGASPAPSAPPESAP